MAPTRSASKINAPHGDSQLVQQRKRRKVAERNPYAGKGESFKKAHGGTNELKSRIRSLSRLLEHNDQIPADVRVEKERALQSARLELDASLRAKQRSEMIARFHKIRFFDRQKATKRLKRAKKDLQACDTEGEQKNELAQRVREAEVDLNYALYYPLHVPYVPLFPTRRKGTGEVIDVPENESAKHATSDIPRREGDEMMRQRVQQCMLDGTLDSLREGKLTDSSAPGSNQPTKSLMTSSTTKLPKKSSPNDPEGRPRSSRLRDNESAEESSNEDGGGFFE